MNRRGGKFITGDLAAFDALFFSIPPAETACIDPQQRILHKTLTGCSKMVRAKHSWLWLRRLTFAAAGNPIETISGTENSLHGGCFSHSYETMFTRDPEALAKYQVCGTGPTMLANRPSWVYNLRCPTIARDRACSSSMYALHSAVQKTSSSETSLVC